MGYPVTNQRTQLTDLLNAPFTTEVSPKGVELSGTMTPARVRSLFANTDDYVLSAIASELGSGTYVHADLIGCARNTRMYVDHNGSITQTNVKLEPTQYLFEIGPDLQKAKQATKQDLYMLLA